MKLIRFGEVDKKKPGIVLDDTYYDVSSFVHDYNEHFFESEGVGLGMKPQLFLKAGYVMELGIEGFGTARQKCIPYAAH